MDERAANLKHHLTNTYGLSPSLVTAFHAWINSVEERLHSPEVCRVLREFGESKLTAAIKSAAKSEPPPAKPPG